MRILARTPAGTPRTVEVTGPDRRNSVRLTIYTQSDGTAAELCLDVEGARELGHRLIQTAVHVLSETRKGEVTS